MSISVVIPYFQKRPGILPRALASVYAQEGMRDLSVVVVDDGSPSPAANEIHGDASRLTVLRQANRGPGAARNAGLNLLPPSTEFVAFLDSDDAWRRDHLARALQVLDQGFDFYFTNFAPVGGGTPSFSRRGFWLAEHPLIGRGLHRYVGDFVERELCQSQVGTGTVVYRYRAHPTIRFPESFSYGEDTAFWLQLGAATRSIAFSSEVEMVCGRGVNISDRAVAHSGALDENRSRFRSWLDEFRSQRAAS